MSPGIFTHYINMIKINENTWINPYLVFAVTIHANLTASGTHYLVKIYSSNEYIELFENTEEGAKLLAALILKRIRDYTSQ